MTRLISVAWLVVVVASTAWHEPPGGSTVVAKRATHTGAAVVPHLYPCPRHTTCRLGV